MNKNDNNISLDDISFDDMLGEGIEDVAPTADDAVEDDDANDLDKDADDLKPKGKDDKDLEDEDEGEDEDEDVDPNADSDEDDDDSDGEEDDSVVGEILSNLGYDSDEEYDDTAEGLTKLTKDMGAKMAESQLHELFDKFPLIKDHLNYVMNGGESQDFMKAYDPTLDYNKIEIDESDVQSQKSILGDYFASKGHDKDFINELLEDYEDTGKLHQKATAAKAALAKVQNEDRQTLISRQKEDRVAAEKKQEEFWSGVHKTINDSQEFAGLTVPQKEKGKFFEYISKPVNKEGHTQRDIDHNESEMEVKLAIDFLMYKGFKLDDIINKKAKTKNARSLRDKISKNSDSVKSARKSGRRSSSFDLEDLDLSL